MPAWNPFPMLKTIREVDLGEIQAHAEQRFTLLIAGDPALAERLADALSAAPGKVGRHPWIELLPAGDGTPPGTEAGVRIALVATPTAELDAAAARALDGLHAAGIPAVAVVMADGADGWHGAELRRGREAARAVLPAAPAAADIQARLAPALRAATAAADHVRLALARQLPVLREPLIAALVDDVARTNATYAFSTGVAEIAPVLTIPLNLADVFVLTKNQLVMAYKIALMAGKHGSVRALMTEVAGVIGGGLLFRQIARELVGLIPVIGIVPKVAVAYAGTRLIGEAILRWEVHGERVSRGELRALYDETLAAGRQLAETLWARARSGADRDAVDVDGAGGAERARLPRAHDGAI